MSRLNIFPSTQLNNNKMKNNKINRKPSNNTYGLKFNCVNLLIKIFVLLLIGSIVYLVNFYSIDYAYFMSRGLLIRTFIILLKYLPVTILSFFYFFIIAFDFDPTSVQHMFPNNPPANTNADKDTEMTDAEKMPPPPPAFDPPFNKADMDQNVLRIEGNRYYITHAD